MPPTHLMNDPVPTLAPQVTRVGMASLLASFTAITGILLMLIIDAWVHAWGETDRYG